MSCTDRKVKNTSTAGIATVMCDESFRTILDQEIDVFEYTYTNASIMPYYVSERNAIDSLMKERTGLIITANQLTPEQQQYLEKKVGMCYSQRIAVDAIAIIVNNDNPVDSLSISELAAILDGRMATWNAKSDSINVVFDSPKSSLVKYMRDSVIVGKPFTKRVYAQKTNDAVFRTIQKSRNSIGIIGVSWLSTNLNGDEATPAMTAENVSKEDTTNTKFTKKVKVLKIYKDGAKNAYKPYQANIYNGSYPLYRNIYATCASPRGSLSHGFYTFITGFIGQKIILKTGILPSVIHPRVVNLN